MFSPTTKITHTFETGLDVAFSYFIYSFSAFKLLYLSDSYERIYFYERIFLSVQLLHTGKYFQNFIKSTRNQIAFTIFWFIWIQMDARLDPYQSENGKYNLISGWFNKISKTFLSAYTLVWLDFPLFSSCVPMPIKEPYNLFDLFGCKRKRDGG